MLFMLVSVICGYQARTWTGHWSVF